MHCVLFCAQLALFWYLARYFIPMEYEGRLECVCLLLVKNNRLQFNCRVQALHTQGLSFNLYHP